MEGISDVSGELQADDTVALGLPPVGGSTPILRQCLHLSSSPYRKGTELVKIGLSGSLSDYQIDLRDHGRDLRPVPSHYHVYLTPHSETTRQIDTGLDRERNAGKQLAHVVRLEVI